MEKLTFRDRMMLQAESGNVTTRLNLYKKQMWTLVDEGYTVQRIAAVDGYPDQTRYLISWKDAIEGTQAYELLKKAAEINPELLVK